MNNNNQLFSLRDLTSALIEQRRASLIQAMKDNIQNLRDLNILEDLSPAVKKRVEVLQEIQGEHDVLEAKYLEEKAALEAKYQTLYQPLYTKRHAIVNGIAQVELDGDVNLASASDAEEKGVPSFWLIALKNNDILAQEITERDEEALQYLNDIKWTRIEDPKGFKLEFFFNANPYFTNPVLTKTYHMVDEDEPILEKAVGTEIDWLPGKCLTEKICNKKLKKISKDGKPIAKTETSESFFNFFDPPEVPEGDEEISDEKAEELQAEMELDYDIGTTIRDKIIPHAVSWFTGEAADGDDDDDDDNDDNSDFTVEEDDDEEEDEKDDEMEETKNGE